MQPRARRPAKSASSSPASRRSTARRSATRSRSRRGPAAAPLPGFKQIKPRVFAGPLSGRLRGLRELSRCAQEAAPERLGAAFRAGGVDRARVRLPLRVSRPAAHGHRAGAAGARVRPESRHERPTVVYEVAQAPTASVEYVDNPAKLPPPVEIAELREPIITAHILVPPDHVGAVLDAVHREARRAEEDAVPRQPGGARISSCRWRRWCSTSSTG